VLWYTDIVNLFNLITNTSFFAEVVLLYCDSNIVQKSVPLTRPFAHLISHNCEIFVYLFCPREICLHVLSTISAGSVPPPPTLPVHCLAPFPPPPPPQQQNVAVDAYSVYRAAWQA
jgi:hypothetical protein